MIKSVVEAYSRLAKRDLRILRIIEAGHRRYEFVPQKLVERWARYRKEEVRDSVKRLHYLGLLRRNLSPYLGWKITAAGYDVLALHTLRIRKKVAKLSPTPVGVGKESVVYAGESPSGFKVAVKFHRGGVSVFRYEEAFSAKVRRYQHLRQVYETRLSALAEFYALEKVFEAGGLVPEPLAYNRHVVVMRFIDGVELYRLDSGDLEQVVQDLLETLHVALRLGIVHGDLSPFNVIVSNRTYVIDWPQWIPLGHPSAETYLRRDVSNIAEYFRERGVEFPGDELLKAAKGGNDSGRRFLEYLKKSLL
ncbi:MAG: phosphotransferase [Pyrobaculum sp.]|nr:phosphotransferase [Pyrobaculum sp.]